MNVFNIIYIVNKLNIVDILNAWLALVTANRQWDSIFGQFVLFTQQTLFFDWNLLICLVIAIPVCIFLICVAHFWLVRFIHVTSYLSDHLIHIHYLLVVWWETVIKRLWLDTNLIKNHLLSFFTTHLMLYHITHLCVSFIGDGLWVAIPVIVLMSILTLYKQELNLFAFVKSLCRFDLSEISRIHLLLELFELHSRTYFWLRSIPLWKKVDLIYQIWIKFVRTFFMDVWFWKIFLGWIFQWFIIFTQNDISLVLLVFTT